MRKREKKRDRRPSQEKATENILSFEIANPMLIDSHKKNRKTRRKYYHSRT